VKGEGFLSKNISGFAHTLESVILNEELSHIQGLLQSLDPRVKVITFVLFIVITGLARSITVLVVIFFLILIMTALSKISLTFFLKRVLIFIPIFTAIIAIPALFITPGTSLVTIGSKIIITEQGARTAGLLFLRVANSMSFGVLLILTTPWSNVLAALRWLRIPSLIVDILGMTYRYIFLLLHNANSMFLARRSRLIGSFSSAENRRWLTNALATTMTKSQHLSEEVYMAMNSRGYQGEIRVLSNFKLNLRDLIWTFFTIITAAIIIWSNYL